MTTLRDLIIASAPNSWAIYATPNADGTFSADSAARWGQPQFENGGVLDDMVFFGEGGRISSEMLEQSVEGFEAADFIIERRNEQISE
jgi:hypothetical protein